jgi:hypothetical protein
MKNKSGGLGENPLFFRPKPATEVKVEPETIVTPETSTVSIPAQQVPAQVKPSQQLKQENDKTVELIRSSVRSLGKEAATHRFTTDEKNAIANIVHSYKQEGVKTSENEITRIAINFIIEDHKKNGASSVLNKVLKALYS